MKLCFLAGANSIHSYRWIKFFADRGHEICWISLAPSIFPPIPDVKYFEVSLSRITPWALISSVLSVRKIVSQFKPDFLHVHSVGAYGLVGLFSGQKKIVATPWGSDVIYGQKSLFKRPFIKAILGRALLVTCDAIHMKEHLLQLGVPNPRIHLINFGIDSKRFKPQAPRISIRAKYELADEQVVISLRNFEPVYDVASLLNAIPEVLREAPRTLFMIVGRGSLEGELKALSKRLNIEDSVRFVGFIPNQDLPETIASMDIYVSTSLSDAGIAASTAEAMACGLPVIVTDSGENNRWIINGINGYLVPTVQPQLLAKQILNLLSDREACKRIGVAGRLTIQERNDYSVEMAKMEQLYQDAIDNEKRL